MTTKTKGRASGEPISVVVANLIGYQAAEPLIDEILSRAGSVWLYAPRSCHPLIRKRRSKLSHRLLAYEELESRQPWVKWVHRLLTVAITPEVYSQIYQNRVLQPLKGSRSWVVRAAARLLLLWPKSAPAMVNVQIQRLVGPLVRQVFRTRRVLAVTRLTVPHLLCRRGLEITTLVESWDHPPKAPIGYSSRRVFVWNKALGEDWCNYQGDHAVKVGYPLKLAYALENRSLSVGAIGWIQRRILYPATYTSYSDRGFFQEELRLLDLLCITAAKAGMRVYIKPKPNGPRGDFKQLKVQLKNIEFGDDGGATGPGEYFLDEKYNTRRIKVMRRCDAVVNLGTTFGLDAAAFGLPVFQLFIRDPFAFPRLTVNFQYDHLCHLLGQNPAVYQIDVKNPAATVFEGFFNNNSLKRAARFSRNLRAWLTSQPGSCDKAVSKMVDDIFGNQPGGSGGGRKPN